MLENEGIKNFSDQIHEFWIEPEINTRRESNSLPDNFQIYRCLIRLPKDKRPIVEFNDEVSWIAKAKYGDGTPISPGSELYLHDIREIESVEPPEIDGQRVAFVFLFWNGFEYQVCFDFSPNWPDNEFGEDGSEWSFGRIIAGYLQALLTERTVYRCEELQEKFHAIGLWAAPALLPYPLSRIAKQLEDGDIDGTCSTLISYCTPDFHRSLSAKWWDIGQFAVRQKLIEEALAAHQLGYYHLSVHALIPHAEGIITDWEYSLNVANDAIPFRAESKTRKFKDLVLGKEPTTLTYRKIVESTITFILEGPVLRIFKKWLDQVDSTFPNRHAMGHGRYDATLFTEENSIKIFLMLDTIYHLISANTKSTSLDGETIV